MEAASAGIPGELGENAMAARNDMYAQRGGMYGAGERGGPQVSGFRGILTMPNTASRNQLHIAAAHSATYSLRNVCWPPDLFSFCFS
jgi:hypothetical protein